MFQMCRFQKAPNDPYYFTEQSRVPQFQIPNSAPGPLWQIDASQQLREQKGAWFRAFARSSSSTASPQEGRLPPASLLAPRRRRLPQRRGRSFTGLLTANLQRLRPPSAASSVVVSRSPRLRSSAGHLATRRLGLGAAPRAPGPVGGHRETTAPTMPRDPRRDWLSPELRPIGRGLVGRWRRSRKRRRTGPPPAMGSAESREGRRAYFGMDQEERVRVLQGIRGYTTFTIIHCHGRQVWTTAEGKVSEEVVGHKGQHPVCPHQRGHVSPTCGYRFTATSASAHCELGLAWQRLQGTMHRALPHGNLIPGGGTDQEKERGRRIRKNCKCHEENKKDAKSDGASCSGGLVRQCCSDEVTVMTGLGQWGEASLLWAEWFQGTVSPGPQADLVRSHPHAEVRKQVQGGEGTPGHSELVVELEAQTSRLHSLCAWQPHRGNANSESQESDGPVLPSFAASTHLRLAVESGIMAWVPVPGPGTFQHVARNRTQVSKILVGQRFKLLSPYFLDETISPETLWY
ncbi:hypothetical protein J1605_006412 [Eschrichtius robustus]|uniref:Uncharacterized protein n=1 Tax=Eschrichtius robustus TaxID=9764 RepID=A0AB34H436_ESCRO|nr:hypothetical protein J1605_006412 [Eschrichtius robustus]